MTSKPLSLMALGLLILSLLAHGCGGRSLPGGPIPDGAVADSGSPTGDGAPPQPGCTIAIRTDHCCTAPRPALVQQVAQDPCLVPYPATNATITAACKAKWPKECEVIDCGHARPASRLVQAVPGGGCVWQSECDGDADCTAAVDARQCCSCGAAYPKSLVAKEVCLHDYYVNHPPPAHCNSKACAGVKCKPCPGAAPQISCSAGSIKGVNNCTPFLFY